MASIQLSQLLALPLDLLYQSLELQRHKEWKAVSQDKLDYWEKELTQRFDEYNQQMKTQAAIDLAVTSIQKAFVAIESQGCKTEKTEEVRQKTISAFEKARELNSLEMQRKLAETKPAEKKRSWRVKVLRSGKAY